MVQPSKYHDRMKPISSTLKSMEMDDESEEEFDLDEFISELEDDITLDEILHEMGYYDDDSEEELDEMKLDFNSKGYKEARKLIQKLRGKLFRELDPIFLNYHILQNHHYLLCLKIDTQMKLLK